MKNFLDGRKQASGVLFRDASSLYCETLGRLFQGIKTERFAVYFHILYVGHSSYTRE